MAEPSSDIADRVAALRSRMAAAAAAAGRSPSDVRLLAAALSIQYRELSDHTFNHSAIISLADRDGVVQAQTADLTDAKGTFVTAVRRQVPPGARSDAMPGVEPFTG